MNATTYHATKYDTAAAEVIALLSDTTEGYGTDSDGDVESPTGAFALVVLDDTCDLSFADTTGAYPHGDKVGETARTYGVTADDVRGAYIVTTDEQGFVAVEQYDTADDARAAYDCLSGQYDAWSSDDDSEGHELYVCPVAGHGYHRTGR